MTLFWIIVFFGSLFLLLVLLVIRGLKMQRTVPVLNRRPSATSWFHPTLPKNADSILSFAIFGKILSYILFVIVTILDELLHRCVHGLKSITSRLITWIDAYERKHHPSQESSSRMSELKNILDNSTSENSSQM
jgi:hypothetical protein